MQARDIKVGYSYYSRRYGVFFKVKDITSRSEYSIKFITENYLNYNCFPKEMNSNWFQLDAASTRLWGLKLIEEVEEVPNTKLDGLIADIRQTIDNALLEIGEHTIEKLLEDEVRIKASLDEARKAAREINKE